MSAGMLSFLAFFLKVFPPFRSGQDDEEGHHVLLRVVLGFGPLTHSDVYAKNLGPMRVPWYSMGMKSPKEIRKISVHKGRGPARSW